MNSKTVTIPTMNCGHCLNTIRTELLDIEGVGGVTGDPSSKVITVSWEAPADWNAIESMLDEIGYSPEK